MARQHGNNFSTKHPLGTQVADHISDALKPCIRKGKIACVDVHALAGEINVPAHQVGIAIDLCEARIVACQLGLFGGSSSMDAERPIAPLPTGFEAAIQASLQDNSLTCQQAWQLAQSHGMTRRQVGQFCNALEIKITQCQLGAF